MKFKKFFVSFISGLTLVVMCSSCVSSTRVNFNTDVDGATVYVDGEEIGTTPAQIKLSNAVREIPDVVIKKDGYRDLYTELNKEVKGVNLVCGLLLWLPSLLWVYGPKKNQNYMLSPLPVVQDTINE